tara:strand:+ start:535 stop:963 length:429 start_codon:yes stop_codon:yes gene_type:complete
MLGERIEGFDGDYRFLSNFYPALVELDGIMYPSVEHAYQAAKTLDENERQSILVLEKPGQAKKAGREVTLRQDLEEVKMHVMLDLVRYKFYNCPDLKNKLLATGDAYIEETNWWGDTFWGVCEGKGKNVLGTILMNVRAELI